MISPEKSIKIKERAEYIFKDSPQGNSQVFGYITGATEEALRALPLVEALEKIQYGIFPMSNMEAINFINNAMNMAAEALDNYKNNNQ